VRWRVGGRHDGAWIRVEVINKAYATDVSGIEASVGRKSYYLKVLSVANYGHSVHLRKSPTPSPRQETERMFAKRMSEKRRLLLGAALPRNSGGG